MFFFLFNFFSKNKQTIFSTLSRPRQANRIGYVIHFYVGNLSSSIFHVCTVFDSEYGLSATTQHIGHNLHVGQYFIQKRTSIYYGLFFLGIVHSYTPFFRDISQPTCLHKMVGLVRTIIMTFIKYVFNIQHYSSIYQLR